MAHSLKKENQYNYTEFLFESWTDQK